MWSSSPTPSPFKTPPASLPRRASWWSSRRAATGNSPRWVDSLPEESYAIHACAPADAARARSRGRARINGWSDYDSSKVLTLTGTIREAGYEHPHGFVKLETPGKIWLVVLAPPSRMENRGDEGRYLHEAAEESNLH